MNDDELAKIRARSCANVILRSRTWNAELRKSLGLEEINHDDSQEVVDAKVLERAEVLDVICDGMCDVERDGKCDVEAIEAHMRLRYWN